ncbi:glycosyltransferase family 2 protein [Pseudomonas sp. NC26]|uniref:glycosyltransferase family 2 protein n=1 Tax=unclassified Pseudomonas TaxID=196821 RepID=UPI00257E0B12|nr:MULTISPECIES: glycosyltransferase family 2 protein [unclassified Pseudomonas]MEC4875653.1 glycosyltransferase family 2 protein [Pseudomonas sp. NC26]
MNRPVLVSIVIPAYKPQFFEKALLSAMVQDYDQLEIVVCDDCRDDSIARIVERCRPISYDDDLLMPGAVSKLLAALQQHPRAVMATGKRHMIDTEGKHCGESLLTLFPFAADVIVDGKELASFLGQHIYNFIGEPTSIMCRREDVLAFGDEIMSLLGEVVYWVGDLSLYVKLLQHGDLIMLAEPLACFRISTLQTSQIARDTPQVAVAPYAHYRAAMAALGWVRPAGINGTVKVAELTAPDCVHELNLAAYFSTGGALPMGNARLQAWSHANTAHVPVRNWLAHRTLTPKQQCLLDQHRRHLGAQAGVEVIVLDRRGDADALVVSLASLERWARGSSTPLHWQVISSESDGWVERVNDQVHRSDKGWLLMLEAGDELLLSGTLKLDLKLADAGDASMIYCDELQRGDPDLVMVARPGLCLDYLLGAPALMAGHWLLRRDLVEQAGGYDPALPDAIELDLILRLLDGPGLAGIAQVAEPLLLCDAPALQGSAHEQRSIERHLARRGYAQARVAWQERGGYRIHYGHARQPGVSIVMSGAYPMAVLQRCLESLLGNTDYPVFEVLVLDHLVSDTVTRQWLQELRQMGSEQLSVLSVAANLDPEQALDQAVEVARGEYLVLLEGDTQVIQADWLEALLEHGLRAEVALVAGTLVSPSGRIQQSGLIGGLHGVVGPAFEHLDISQSEGMLRTSVAQNFSAVPSACMLLSRQLYQQLGGMDASLPTARLRDVDFCRRAAESGRRIVWTPHARLGQSQRTVHPGSEQALEQAVAITRGLSHDAAYNPNLTLQGQAYTLEMRAELTWRPLSWRPLPVVLAFPDRQREARESRVVAPLCAMVDAGLVDALISDQPLNAAQVSRLAPDVVVFQDNLGELPLQAMREARLIEGAFLVLEVQAFLSTVTDDPQHDPVVRWEALTQAAQLVDRLIVPTRALADAFAPLHTDVQVLETRLAPSWASLPGAVAPSARPRVGCCIEPSSSLDPQLMATLVQALAPQVDWVLWGRVPGALRALAHEVHDGALHEDPQRLAGLQLDLALAPLGTSGLDGCCSALPLLRFAACGYNVLCSDSAAYEVALDITRVGNTLVQWLQAIEQELQDLARAHHKGERLRQQVLQGWLLDEGGAHLAAKAWLPR